MIDEDNRLLYIKIKENCMRNAKKIINVAKDVKENNISFYLAVVALEEIGKMYLCHANILNNTFKEEDISITNKTDDHVKKIFYALWSLFFTNEKITNESIEAKVNAAKHLHEKKLDAIYYNPKKDKLLEIDDKFRNDTISVVEHMIKKEEETGFRDDTASIEYLEWFTEAANNIENKKMILGRKSLDKLNELGDVYEWVKWLKHIYDQNQKELDEILKVELSNSKNANKNELKWDAKIKFKSLFHRISSRELADWNKKIELIKLYRGGNKYELTCHFLLYNKVKLDNLYNVLFESSKIFILSLNIGTAGYFWWYLPSNDIRFFDKLSDLDRKIEVRVQESDEFKFNIKIETLTQKLLHNVQVVHLFVLNNIYNKLNESFDHYIWGLAFIAKNDMYLQSLFNSLEEFYLSLKLGLKFVYKNETDTVCVLFKSFLNDELIINQLKIVEEHITNIRMNKPTKEKVTPDDVIFMKTCCDIFYRKVAENYLKDNIKNSSHPITQESSDE